MMRQIGKKFLTIAVLAALSSLVGIIAPAIAASIVTSVVTDPLTGVAIDGYDPVSYFTEPEPLPGSPDYEFVWGGVPWYFASAANRDVFMRTPETYAPQHGGHCVMSLSRGYLSDGKPRVYLVAADRLFLFYSTANREAFLLSPVAAVRAADSHWAELSRELSTN